MNASDGQNNETKNSTFLIKNANTNTKMSWGKIKFMS